MLNTVFFIIGLVGGAGVTYFLTKSRLDVDLQSAEKKLKEAEEEAVRIKQESKSRFQEFAKHTKQEEKTFEETLKRLEEMVVKKEEILKRYEERNAVQQKNLENIKKDVESAIQEEAKLVDAIVEGLAKKSKLSKEKALEQARAHLTDLITRDAERRVSYELEELEEEAPRHAKAFLQSVIQRLGVSSSVDKNNTSVVVKDDKFKGLLVGKDGVNVRYFESLLPVSLIFNLGDPQTIHVGGVNLLRRNIAKKAIEKLQTVAKKKGGLDHQAIKAAVDEAEKEIMAACDRKGEESLKLLGLDPKNTQAELVNYVGRLYFRTSYGQNVTGHSNEMAFAARMLAELIGADKDVAMQAAFYHDIGKAIDHDVGGAHDDLSKAILEKFNYDPRIVHGAFAHHDKVPCESPEDFLVKAVDAISGGRPGARQESVTNYFERIQKLEDAALSFEGVNKVFAMSAGRELRLIVDNDRVHDADMLPLAEQVAGKISEEVAFPGVIKVNLIRSTKAVDYAREMNPQKRPARK